METLVPVKAFEALAHETRLAVFRLLIPAGLEGLPAGVISAQLGLPPNSLSFHLGRLANAGLVSVRREGRRLYYAVHYPRVSALIGYLVNDCCAEAPAGCLPDCPSVSPAVGATCSPLKEPAHRRESGRK